MEHLLPQRSISLCTSPKQGQSTTTPVPSFCRLLQFILALLLVYLVSYSTRNSAGSLTCTTLSPSLPPRPTSSKGSRPQHGAPPYGFRGCSTLLSYAQPSPLAALLGGPPHLRHFSEKGWGRSSRKLKTVASEPSLGPTKPHQYEAFRQKWASPHCLFTWMAGTPVFD
jgi:hypothetical protein